MILIDILVRECGCKVITVFLVTPYGIATWVHEDRLDCWFIDM